MNRSSQSRQSQSRQFITPSRRQHCRSTDKGQICQFINDPNIQINRRNLQSTLNSLESLSGE